jgi:hypothetical protein
VGLYKSAGAIESEQVNADVGHGSMNPRASCYRIILKL